MGRTPRNRVSAVSPRSDSSDAKWRAHRYCEPGTILAANECKKVHFNSNVDQRIANRPAPS
eukprot:3725171-Rhodomonas_salina.4